MGRRSTRERLDRLHHSVGPKRAPARGPSPPESEEGVPTEPNRVKAGLRRVEKELLGSEASDEGLTVKQRLERLVAAAEKRAIPRHRGPSVIGSPETTHRSGLHGERGFDTMPVSDPVQTPLHELVPAEEIETEDGQFLRIDWRYPMNHRHGRVPLESIFQIPPDGFGVMSSDHREIDLRRSIFLDTETTGLAGGSGTCAFLVGVGFVEDEEFVVRQFFMRDYVEERAMLSDLTELLSRFDCLLTYNGKSFDIPLLETRLVMTRQRYSFEDMVHFDLLHPARNLWKRRFDSCRLSELESTLLGLYREDDVPGHLIPTLYFNFLRAQHSGPMVSVLSHNRYDILSLAALTARAAEMLNEDYVPDNPLDDLSLGMLFERAESRERSIHHYRRAIDTGLDGRPRQEAQLRLASLLKKLENWGEAETLWAELCRQDTELAIPALTELAMLDEHRRKDFERALDYCELALDQLSQQYHWPLRFREKWTEAFQHRRRRLRRRQKGVPLSREEQEALSNLE